MLRIGKPSPQAGQVELHVCKADSDIEIPVLPAEQNKVNYTKIIISISVSEHRFVIIAKKF